MKYVGLMDERKKGWMDNEWWHDGRTVERMDERFE